METIVRKDTFSGLYSEEYLYGEGKKKIDKYTLSTICMFKITNLPTINEQYSRELGNKVISTVAEYIKENISENYIFVRYMGPKFVIVFSGVESESVAEFLNELKVNVEKLQISLQKPDSNVEEEYIHENNQKRKNTNNTESVNPKLNFVISSYYKGTGLEEVAKKLEQYLDNANEDESEINNI